MSKLLTIIALSVALAACGTSVKLKDDDDAKSNNSTNSTKTAQVDSSNNIDGQDIEKNALDAINATFVIYFDFDNYSVNQEYQNDLILHAKYLQKNTNYKVALEGHADNRGSREYNLALGQKRAVAVLKTLTFLGVDSNHLEAISYGEEKPAVEGHSEEAYAKNRRVEIRYYR